MTQFRPDNTTPELVHAYTKANGTKVKQHERAPKNFMQNRWIGIPDRIRLRDPGYQAWLEWHAANS